MNRYYYAVLLTLLSLNAISQSKIEGIGRFKVGITTIDSINGNHLKKIDEDWQRVATGEDLVEISPFQPGQSDPVKGAPVCKESRVFYSDRYLIAGVEVTDLYLTFFKDVLYKIDCTYSDELKEALIFKYGPGNITKTKQVIKCTYKLTGRVSGAYDAGITKRLWTNGNIYALLFHQIVYDEQCRAEEKAYFTLNDTSRLKESIACNNAARSKIKADIEILKVKKMSEF